MFCTNLGRMVCELPGWAAGLARGGRRVTFLRHREALGDLLEVTALIRGLKKADPAVSIAVATRRPEVFLHNPYVDEIRGWHLWRTRYTVRGSYGMKDLLGREHVIAVQWRNVWNELAQAGYRVPTGGPPPHAGLYPEVFLTDKERAQGRAALTAAAGAGSGGRPVVLISSGGKTVPVHNREWGAANFQALVDALAPHVNFIQFGGETRLSTRGQPLPSLAGRPVREAAALLTASAAFVSQEGGLVHLARAVQTPSVVIFGGSLLPEQTGYPENANLCSRPECSPCFGSGVNCPHLKCMTPITPRAAARAMAGLLARRDMQLPEEAVRSAPDEWNPPPFVDRAVLERALSQGQRPMVEGREV